MALRGEASAERKAGNRCPLSLGPRRSRVIEFYAPEKRGQRCRQVAVFLQDVGLLSLLSPQAIVVFLRLGAVVLRSVCFCCSVTASNIRAQDPAVLSSQNRGRTTSWSTSFRNRRRLSSLASVRSHFWHCMAARTKHTFAAIDYSSRHYARREGRRKDDKTASDRLLSCIVHVPQIW